MNSYDASYAPTRDAWQAQAEDAATLQDAERWYAEDVATQQLQQRGVPAAAPHLATALPEAPASVNCYVALAGRQVQVTLRDTDEARLLARLVALLERFPVPEAGQTPPEGWCARHDVEMPLQTNEHGSWRSHKTADGWCKGKPVHGA